MAGMGRIHGGRDSEIRRACKLVRMLSTTTWITTADVMRELECSERTARRWIESMCQAGWPVEERISSRQDCPGRYAPYKYRLMNARRDD